MTRPRTSPATQIWTVLVAAALQSCTYHPPTGQSERFPVVLAENRPLYILRIDAERYTCAGGTPLICDGATRTYLLCRCPFVPR